MTESANVWKEGNTWESYLSKEAFALLDTQARSALQLPSYVQAAIVFVRVTCNYARESGGMGEAVKWFKTMTSGNDPGQAQLSDILLWLLWLVRFHSQFKNKSPEEHMACGDIWLSELKSARLESQKRQPS